MHDRNLGGGALHEIEVMLDNDYAHTGRRKPAHQGDQTFDLDSRQSCSWLVEEHEIGRTHGDHRYLEKTKMSVPKRTHLALIGFGTQPDLGQEFLRDSGARATSLAVVLGKREMFRD